MQRTPLTVSSNVSIETQAAFEKGEARGQTGCEGLRADMEDGLSAVKEGVANMTEMLYGFRLGTMLQSISAPTC